MRPKFLVCFSIFPLLLQGCHRSTFAPTNNRTAQSIYSLDSWYKAAPTGMEPWSWNKLNAGEVHVLPSTAKSQAERLLRYKPLIPLYTKQVKALIGHQLALPKSSKKVPYLVRSVYFNKETGQFEVYYKDNKLWVAHGSLGHSPEPMNRQALIVLLRVRPSRVFVTCSMAQ